MSLMFPDLTGVGPNRRYSGEECTTYFHDLRAWAPSSAKPCERDWLRVCLCSTIKVKFWYEYALSEWDRHAIKYFLHEGD